MNLSILLEKSYLHFFKTMPAEGVLKKKWDVYGKMEKRYYGHSFDLSCIKGNRESVADGKTIWFYWNKGLNNAPAVVKKCYEALLRNTPSDWRVIMLTEEEAREYVQLPAFIEKLKDEKKMWYALYSDLVRLALLYRYGGIWCDATCYLTKQIPDYILNSPLFFFSFESILTALPSKFENWFIKADKNNYVIERLLQDLLYYWSQPKKQQEYFIWFHLQTALYENDAKARQMMDEIPYVFNYDAMMIEVHYKVEHPYNERLWEYICNKCFVQKITYKYDKKFETTTPENLLQHILNS